MATGRPRRQYGTGSVSQRSSDRRWIGTLEAGWTATGARRRVTVSAACPCTGTCRGPGRCPGEAEAKRRLRDKQREIAEHGTPAQDVRARTTVKAWADDWLAQLVTRARPRYYATEASAVRRWIIPTIGHRPLADLTPRDVRAVTGAIRKADRSTTTAAYVQGTLERLLRAAIVEGHPVPQRLLLIEPPGKAVSDRTAMDPEHALALLAAAAQHPDGSRWVAALLQGMRQGECLGLTWDAVDLAAGTVDVSWQLQALPYLDRAAGTFRVPDGYEARRLERAWHLVRPKTSAGERIIPLVPWMTAALAAWRERTPASTHGLVWSVTEHDDPRMLGRPRSPALDRDAWYALQQEAGVAHPSGRPYVLHEARHTTATLLLEADVDAAVVIAIMGHSKITTTRGYQHVSQALARRALDDVAQRLGLTAGPLPGAGATG
jgi:integrase